MLHQEGFLQYGIALEVKPNLLKNIAMNAIFHCNFFTLFDSLK